MASGRLGRMFQKDFGVYEIEKKLLVAVREAWLAEQRSYFLPVKVIENGGVRQEIITVHGIVKIKNAVD